MHLFIPYETRVMTPFTTMRYSGQTRNYLKVVFIVIEEAAKDAKTKYTTVRN